MTRLNYENRSVNVVGKKKCTLCTGTEALYRLYGMDNPFTVKKGDEHGFYF
jgi:hypothetical protein